MHAAGGAGDVDHVARLQRTLEHQDQPRHEVLDHVLQAQADADAERADQQRQLAELEPRGGQRAKQAEHQHRVVGQGSDAVAHAVGQCHPWQQLLAQQHLDQAGDPEGQEHRDHEHGDIAEAERQLPDGHLVGQQGLQQARHRPVDPELLHRRHQPAQHRCNRQQPQEQRQQGGATDLRPSQRCREAAAEDFTQQRGEHGVGRMHEQRDVAALDHPGQQHFRQRHIAQQVRQHRDTQRTDHQPASRQHGPLQPAAIGGLPVAADPPRQHQGGRDHQHGKAQQGPAEQPGPGQRQQRKPQQQVLQDHHVWPPAQASADLRGQQAQHRDQYQCHRQLVHQQRRLGFEHQHPDHRQQHPARDRASQRLGRIDVGRGRADPHAPGQPQQQRQQEQLEELQDALVGEPGVRILPQEMCLQLKGAGTGGLSAGAVGRRGGMPDDPGIAPQQALVDVGDGAVHRGLAGLDLSLQQVGATTERDLRGQRCRQRLLCGAQFPGDCIDPRRQRLREAAGRQCRTGGLPIRDAPGQLVRAVGQGFAGGLVIRLPSLELARVERPVPGQAFQAEDGHHPQARIAGATLLAGDGGAKRIQARAQFGAEIDRPGLAPGRLGESLVRVGPIGDLGQRNGTRRRCGLPARFPGGRCRRVGRRKSLLRSAGHPCRQQQRAGEVADQGGDGHGGSAWGGGSGIRIGDSGSALQPCVHRACARPGMAFIARAARTPSVARCLRW